MKQPIPPWDWRKGSGDAQHKLSGLSVAQKKLGRAEYDF